MEFIQTLFASVTMVWCAFIVFFFVIAILLENEREGWATTITSLGLALAIWLNKETVFEFLKTHPSQILGFAGAYILVGVIWSLIKWQLYVKNSFRRLKEIKKEFITKVGKIDDSNRWDFNTLIINEKIKGYDGYNISITPKTPLEDIVERITPIATRKKATITSWISYWPISLTATLLNNPFRRFFEWVYESISGSYDKITNSTKKQILND